MPRYPLGSVILLVTLIFLLFGMVRGLPAGLRLRPRTVFWALAAWWLLSYLEIPVRWAETTLIINPAGTVVPLVFGLWLGAGPLTANRWVGLAVGMFAVVGILGQQTLGLEPDHYFWDGHWWFTLLGAVGAVALTGELRGAMAAVLLGSALVEGLGPFLGFPGPLALGKGLAFDRVVVAALLVFILGYLWDVVRMSERGGGTDQTGEL
ncbi:MAG: hypothetical protein PHC60_03340 [Heliobacteriaceae bacterium]|nr:hypothetical protein [Heliobacteriaceae bacterium]MDD4587415.1 hypothetical protein [Heliobacteriaceae bacterium]